MYVYVRIYLQAYIYKDTYTSIARIFREEGGRHMGERAK